VIERADKVRSMLDKYGFPNTESILNEWNYVRGWVGDEWLYSLRMEKGLKGAAFIAATMIESQKSSIDLLMYYDARPSGMNGMFCTDFVCDCLKGYYPFRMFNELYKLGESVEAVNGEKIYAAAARSDKRGAIMLTHYDDNDSAAARNVRVEIRGRSEKNGVRARCYLLDQENDMQLVREEVFSGDEFTVFLKMKNLSTVLIELE